MRSKAYPLGHPRVYTREELRQPPTPPFPWTRVAHNPFRGLLKVRVLPPRGLRLTLLPYRTRDGRLTFPLCAACAEECRVNAECQHVVCWRKRSWVAAFTHSELNAALDLGYTVTEVFEVWHYQRWSGERGEPHLYRSYMDEVLRWKWESDGWPAHCRTDADKLAYLRHFFEREGIQLRPEELDGGLNAALRMIAVFIFITIV